MTLRDGLYWDISLAFFVAYLPLVIVWLGTSIVLLLVIWKKD